MSLQTPLARVRGLGSAKTGVHHWWMQRLTAVILTPLCFWFVFSVLQLAQMDYQEVIHWMRNPVDGCFLLIFLVALFYHTLLGMQVVIEDYIENEAQKLFCLVSMKLLVLLMGATSTFAVLKISLGG